MIKKVFAFLAVGLCLSLEGAGPEDPALLPALPRREVRAILDAASGERAMVDIRHLALLHRWFVSPGYDRAADYVIDRAGSAGLTGVRLEKFPSDGSVFYLTMRSLPRWTVDAAELRMESPRREHVISWAEMPTCLASNSRSASVEAELIDVGEGVDPSDYAGKDVRGKLVLASSPQGKGRIELVHRLAVLERGAAGVVSYRSYYPDDFPDLVTWDHILTLEANGRLSTFGFCVSKRLGHEWQRLLRDGRKVVLRAEIESALAPGALGVVEAAIPGRDYPDQEVWFIAHLDHACPGANDNASGSAAVLECARAYLELFRKGALRGPRRTLRFLWVPEMYGTAAYLSAHPERVRKAVAVINLDMVGENQKLCGSTFQVTMTPDSTPSFLNDLLGAGLDLLLGAPPWPGGDVLDSRDLFSPTGSRDPWQARLVPYSGGSDHEIFLGGGFDVPATMFGSWPDYYYHTNQDTPDKCDPTQLRRAVALAMLTGASIASMEPADALEFAATLSARGSQRMGLDLQRAAGLLESSALGGRDLREAVNFIDRGADREEGAMMSLARLFPGDRAVSAAIGRRAAELRREAEGRKALLLETYSELCAGRGVRPARYPPDPGPEEPAASKVVPARNPALPGPLSEEYLTLRLGPREAPPALSGFAAFEAAAFIDGKRTLLDIRNAVSAECGPVELADLTAYVKRLERAGAVTMREEPPDR